LIDPLAQRAGFSGISLAHNVRVKEDVDKILNRAVAAGGKIQKPAQDAFWAGTADTSRIPMAISGKSRGARFPSAKTEVSTFRSAIGHLLQRLALTGFSARLSLRTWSR
jgi:hypothetical protein